MTSARQDDASPRGLARALPITQLVETYQRGWLRDDVIAGVAVTALVVPKALGYAEIAEVPVEHGLDAAAAGAILHALFCTARQISTGPSSALAAVAAAPSCSPGPQARTR
jgi:SulP family sulfate permease